MRGDAKILCLRRIFAIVAGEYLRPKRLKFYRSV